MSVGHAKGKDSGKSVGGGGCRGVKVRYCDPLGSILFCKVNLVPKQGSGPHSAVDYVSGYRESR